MWLDSQCDHKFFIHTAGFSYSASELMLVGGLGCGFIRHATHHGSWSGCIAPQSPRGRWCPTVPAVAAVGTLLGMMGSCCPACSCLASPVCRLASPLATLSSFLPHPRPQVQDGLWLYSLQVRVPIQRVLRPSTGGWCACGQVSEQAGIEWPRWDDLAGTHCWPQMPGRLHGSPLKGMAECSDAGCLVQLVHAWHFFSTKCPLAPARPSSHAVGCPLECGCRLPATAEGVDPEQFKRETGVRCGHWSLAAPGLPISHLPPAPLCTLLWHLGTTPVATPAVHGTHHLLAPLWSPPSPLPPHPCSPPDQAGGGEHAARPGHAGDGRGRAGLRAEGAQHGGSPVLLVLCPRKIWGAVLCRESQGSNSGRRGRTRLTWLGTRPLGVGPAAGCSPGLPGLRVGLVHPHRLPGGFVAFCLWPSKDHGWYNI